MDRSEGKRGSAIRRAQRIPRFPHRARQHRPRGRITLLADARWQVGLTARRSIETRTVMEGHAGRPRLPGPAIELSMSNDLAAGAVRWRETGPLLRGRVAPIAPPKWQVGPRNMHPLRDALKWGQPCFGNASGPTGVFQPFVFKPLAACSPGSTRRAANQLVSEFEFFQVAGSTLPPRGPTPKRTVSRRPVSARAVSHTVVATRIMVGPSSQGSPADRRAVARAGRHCRIRQRSRWLAARPCTFWAKCRGVGRPLPCGRGSGWWRLVVGSRVVDPCPARLAP